MRTQGAARRRCRGQLGVQEGQHLVYLELVENAPRNRPELIDPPRYRSVGSILIQVAVPLSEELGFHGKIGLHPPPQENGLYANACGMTDLEADPDHEGLRCFEMSPESARAFIAKGRPI